MAAPRSRDPSHLRNNFYHGSCQQAIGGPTSLRLRVWDDCCVWVASNSMSDHDRSAIQSLAWQPARIANKCRDTAPAWQAPSSSIRSKPLQPKASSHLQPLPPLHTMLISKEEYIKACTPTPPSTPAKRRSQDLAIPQPASSVAIRIYPACSIVMSESIQHALLS